MSTTVALSGCSSSSSDAGSNSGSSGSSGSASSAKPAAPEPNLTKVSADLKPLAKALYTGGTIAATGPAKKVVRKLNRPKKTVVVASTKASWKGTPVAVLTSGKDATFAVKNGKTWKAVGGWWPSLGKPKTTLGGKQFVLFMGSDARVQRGQNILRSRADSLQVMGTDGKGGGGVMGIARDLWVNVPAGGKSKINSPMEHGGPDSQLATIRNVSGLPVRHYVLTGFNDFIWMINAMGGVTVNSTVGVQTQHGYVKQGKNKLDGLGALWYSRERHRLANGDFGRSFNQGTVLLGLAAQTRLAGPSKLIKVMGQASSHVHTDLNAQQALLFAAWLYKINPEKVGHRVAKGPTGTSSDGQSIVLYGPEAQGVFAAFRSGRLR